MNIWQFIDAHPVFTFFMTCVILHGLAAIIEEMRKEPK